jgi:hypothetical protein
MCDDFFGGLCERIHVENPRWFFYFRAGVRNFPHFSENFAFTIHTLACRGVEKISKNIFLM